MKIKLTMLGTDHPFEEGRLPLSYSNSVIEQLESETFKNEISSRLEKSSELIKSLKCQSDDCLIGYVSTVKIYEDSVILTIDFLRAKGMPMVLVKITNFKSENKSYFIFDSIIQLYESRNNSPELVAKLG